LPAGPASAARAAGIAHDHLEPGGAGLRTTSYAAGSAPMTDIVPRSAAPVTLSWQHQRSLRAYRLRGQQIDGTHRLGRTARIDPARRTS